MTEAALTVWGQVRERLDATLQRSEKALDDAVRALDSVTHTDDFGRLMALQEPATTAELWMSRALGAIDSLRLLGHPAPSAEARAKSIHVALEEIWVEISRLQSRIIEQRRMPHG